MDEGCKPLEPLAAVYFGERRESTPYKEARDELDDWFKLIDMLCAALLIRRERGEIAFRRGTPGAPEDVAAALETSAVPAGGASVEGFGDIFLHILRRGAAPAGQAGMPTPIHRLTVQLELTPFELFCVVLAAASDFNRKYERVFAHLQDEPRHTRPSLGLAADLFALLSEPGDDEIYAMCHPESPVNRLVFEPFSDKPEQSRMARPLVLNKYVLYHLSGAALPFDELPAYCDFYEPEDARPLYAHKEQYERVKAIVGRPSDQPTGTHMSILHLHGPEGAGKRFLLRRAASELGIDLVIADCSALLRLPLSEVRHQASRLAAQSVLGGALLCLNNFDVTREHEDMARELLKCLSRTLSFIALCGTAKLPFTLPDGCVCAAIELGSTGLAEQREMWRRFARDGQYDLAGDISIERLVSAYDLPAGHIKDVLRIARLEGVPGEPIGRRQIENAIREKSRVALSSLAELMQTGFTWEDLVISGDSRRLLQKVCDRVQYKRLVNDEWGLAAKLPYGRGLTVLLYGPPGTGKTMAAQVLANEIGRDIYRIELSQMVSKYIGETEKNLGALFDAARNVNAILFFDEADALFSKRTEVKDSKDKYANVETSYLLQKLEAHNGITILATNNALNLDVAFKRRINYFISIEMPSEQARLDIWRSILSGGAPLAKNVDLAFFARRFELSGSEIKSIILESAYMAAAAGSEITHDLLIAAVQDEYKKNGRVLLEQDTI